MIKDSEVSRLAVAIFTAQSHEDTGRVTYLKTFVAAVQDHIKGEKGLEMHVQLAAVQLVHERFYAIVMHAAEPFVPKGTKGRQQLLHNRANFSRAAASLVRHHVRAGADIAALNSDKVTQRSLKKLPHIGARATATALRGRAQRNVTALLGAIARLTEADKAMAIEQIQLAMGSLSSQLSELGVAPIPVVVAQPIIERSRLRTRKSFGQVPLEMGPEARPPH